MRKILIGSGLLLGLGELVSAIPIARQPDGFPAGVIVVGLAFLAVSLWAMRGGRVSAIVLSLLCLFELVADLGIWASKHHPSLGLALSLVGFAAVSLVSIVAGVMTVVTRQRPALS